MAFDLRSTNGSEDPELMLEINTTPLIDVMLVLIIMLIVTIPVQLHSVDLNLPDRQARPPPKPPTIVTIDIDFDGTVLWNGQALAGRAALEARLLTAAAQADQPVIRIRPNRLAEYGPVAMVLASAERLGVTKLEMLGDEPAN